MALLRFACSARDPRTGQARGLFSAAYALLQSDALTRAEDEDPRAHVAHRQTHGLSWLKPDASAAIACFHAIADILGRHGHDADVTRSERPGDVVYEDDHQVVAEPFHGDARR